MAVDLSMIGLAGQEAYDKHKFTQEQTRVAQMEAIAKAQEVEAKQQQQALDQQAAQFFTTVGQGKPVSGGLPADDGSDTMSGSMTKAAQLMFANGAPARGLEFIKAANDIAKQEDDMQNSAIDREKKKAEYELTTGDLVYRYLGTAASQSEWENGRNYLLNSQAISEEHKKAIENLPDEFTPEAAAMLAQHSLSAKDAAQLKLTEQLRDQQDRNLSNTESYRARQIELANANLIERRRAEDRIERAGKAATVPTEQEQSDVAKALINQIPGLDKAKFKLSVNADSSPEDIALSAGALSIASRAKMLLNENRSLDWQTAVSRAILESQQNGDWEDVKTKESHWFGPDTETTTGKKFKDRGKTPEDALPAPKNPRQAIPGTYYITPKGRLRWNGTDFDLPE